ncbi:MAG: FecR family protein, partial [Gemmatimonadaceae bacterium]
ADSIVQVAVAEGRVALRSDRAPAGGGAVLTRGQLGSLTRSDTIATVSEADLEAHLGWAEGRLAFRNAPITDVVTQIGRWYDVEVRLADASLASRHLTLSFSDEPLGAVLQAIALSLDARYERTEDAVTFYSGRSRE